MKHWDADNTTMPKHIMIALLGCFKGELGEQYHHIPLAATTNSGLTVRLWVGHLLDELQDVNILHGPLFRSADGRPIKA